MSREWKPGDVAMVAGTAGSAGVRAIWQGNQWATSTGRYLNHWQVTARPLVVIDPEDSRGIAVEIAQRVGNALHVMPGRDISAGIEAAQEALREFAHPKPPKPEEPMGLGAVVEDANGYQWLLVAPGLGEYRWAKRNETAGNWKRYADIDAVKVLSEGVR